MASNRQGLEWRYTSSLHLLLGTWRRLARETLFELGFSMTTASPVAVAARMRNGIRQSLLGAETGIQGPALVRIVNQLVRGGFLLRREDPTDRRNKILYLTHKGRRLSEKIQAALAPLRRELLAGIKNADLATALQVAEAVEASARQFDARRKARFSATAGKKLP